MLSSLTVGGFFETEVSKYVEFLTGGTLSIFSFCRFYPRGAFVFGVFFMKRIKGRARRCFCFVFFPFSPLVVL